MLKNRLPILGLGLMLLYNERFDKSVFYIHRYSIVVVNKFYGYYVPVPGNAELQDNFFLTTRSAPEVYRSARIKGLRSFLQTSRPSAFQKIIERHSQENASSRSVLVSDGHHKGQPAPPSFSALLLLPSLLWP